MAFPLIKRRQTENCLKKNIFLVKNGVFIFGAECEQNFKYGWIKTGENLMRM